jgi:hypothetical protein
MVRNVVPSLPKMAPVVEAICGGHTMSPEGAVQTAVCDTYDELREEYEQARRDWNEQRAAIFELGLRGKEIDDELRCLQARFAKSYALVRNHLRDCKLRESARGAGEPFGGEGHGRGRATFRLSFSSRLSLFGV